MNFIITRLVDQRSKNPIWRIHPSGNYHLTTVLLKEKDVKDLITQIIDQDLSISHFLKTLLKQYGHILKKFEFRENAHGHCYITIEDDPETYHCGITDIYKILSDISERINIQLAEGCTIFLLGHRQIYNIKSILLTKFKQENYNDFINT